MKSAMTPSQKILSIERRLQKLREELADVKRELAEASSPRRSPTSLLDDPVKRKFISDRLVQAVHVSDAGMRIEEFVGCLGIQLKAEYVRSIVNDLVEANQIILIDGRYYTPHTYHERKT